MTMMTHETITGDEEFFALREPWERLHAQVRGTVFQTFDWLSTWWRIYHHHFALRVLTGWEESRLVGIFPCFIQRAHGVSRLRIVGEYGVYGEYTPLVLLEFEDVRLPPYFRG